MNDPTRTESTNMRAIISTTGLLLFWCGCAGVLFLETQVKEAFGRRYIGNVEWLSSANTPPDVKHISDSFYLMLWIAAVGAIMIGVPLISLRSSTPKQLDD
jgi:hypothetical protein